MITIRIICGFIVFLGIVIVGFSSYKFIQILEHLYEYVKESKKFASSLSLWYGLECFKIAKENEPELIGVMKFYLGLPIAGMLLSILGFILLALTSV